jgi:hypothetical protein
VKLISLAFHLGGSVAGLRVHGGKRFVDYREARMKAGTRSAETGRYDFLKERL